MSRVFCHYYQLNSNDGYRLAFLQLWHDIMFHFKLYIKLIILDTKGKL